MGQALGAWIFFQRPEARALKTTPLPRGTRLGHAINRVLLGRRDGVVGTKVVASVR